MSQPLLSICLATYNASHLLRVTLGAVLPQVAAAAGRVELLVVDDASTDNTPKVIKEARSLGPLRYIRNEKNLGVNGNLVHGPSCHAQGRYVWVWNQHCLIRPGMLGHLLSVLEDHPELEVFYGNFRCATYPDDWPEQAVGGYDGVFRYLSNPDLRDRRIERWQDLLDSRTCVCTQSYAHIARREIWTNYWRNHHIGESFRNALSSYPHTCMLVESVFNQPSCYIGSPLITIFNGAQSWSALQSRAGVYLRGYPELVDLLRRRKWRGRRLADAQRWGAAFSGQVIKQALMENRKDVLRMIPAYLLRYGFQRGVASSSLRALIEARCPEVIHASSAIRDSILSFHAYLFHNCRPARWWRSL
jgi:glycosyltransferase involved in cell wall biosynthesis